MNAYCVVMLIIISLTGLVPFSLDAIRFPAFSEPVMMLLLGLGLIALSLIGKAFIARQGKDMSNAQKSKILIIDDSKETLVGLSNFLGNKYTPVTASNGLDGIRIFENDKDGFKLVITDLVMPEISGVGLIKIIKDISPETPVLAMTGWGFHPKALATEVKADLVLEKPIEMEQLDRHITELI
jgi:response regulator RpfG family c-di-GMP phosphodiesterase